LEVLGSGQFGTVFKALKLIDEKKYAVKRIQLNTPEEQNKVKKEVTSLAQLGDCKHIVRYYHVWYESVEFKLQVSFILFYRD
jgi:serine/threonine protein kinase